MPDSHWEWAFVSLIAMIAVTAAVGYIVWYFVDEIRNGAKK